MKMISHYKNTMSPEKDVKSSQISSQIKNSFRTKNALNQWDTDEAAVGIDSGKFFDCKTFVSASKEKF